MTLEQSEDGWRVLTSQELEVIREAVRGFFLRTAPPLGPSDAVPDPPVEQGRDESFALAETTLVISQVDDETVVRRRHPAVALENEYIRLSCEAVTDLRLRLGSSEAGWRTLEPEWP